MAESDAGGGGESTATPSFHDLVLQNPNLYGYGATGMQVGALLQGAGKAAGLGPDFDWHTYAAQAAPVAGRGGAPGQAGWMTGANPADIFNSIVGATGNSALAGLKIAPDNPLYQQGATLGTNTQWNLDQWRNATNKTFLKENEEFFSNPGIIMLGTFGAGAAAGVGAAAAEGAGAAGAGGGAAAGGAVAGGAGAGGTLLTAGEEAALTFGTGEVAAGTGATAAGAGAAGAGAAGAGAGAGGGGSAGSGSWLSKLGEKALTSAATSVGSAVLQAALTPGLKTEDAPGAPNAPTSAAPQAAVAPDAQAIRQQVGSVASGQGQNTTLLTGLSGISTDKYNLGRNTLLGA